MDRVRSIRGRAGKGADRAHSPARRTLVWIGLVGALLLHAPAFSSAAAGVGPTATSARLQPQRMTTGLQVHVRHLGPVDPAALDISCEIIEAWLAGIGGGSCSVDDGHIGRGQQLRQAWHPERGQYDARAVLEQVFRLRAMQSESDRGGRQPADLEVWLTELDAFEGRRPYVFGLASVTDRTALVSTARLSGPRLRQRLARLLHHELGHAMGLPHHHESRCVMRTDHDVQSLDRAPKSACEQCHAQLRVAHAKLVRAGELTRVIARGHAARGEWHRARALASHLADAGDPAVLRDLQREAGPRLSSEG